MTTKANVTTEGAMIFELGAETRMLFERNTKALESIAESLRISRETTVQAIRDAAPAARPAAAPARASASGNLPTTLPNFGKSKGAPIAGASRQDLDYYAGAVQRSIDDPSKAQYLDNNRRMLTAIEAEIARQSGGNGATPPTRSEPPPGFGSGPSDQDIPF